MVAFYAVISLPLRVCLCVCLEGGVVGALCRQIRPIVRSELLLPGFGTAWLLFLPCQLKLSKQTFKNLRFGGRAGQTNAIPRAV